MRPMNAKSPIGTSDYQPPDSNYYDSYDYEDYWLKVVEFWQAEHISEKCNLAEKGAYPSYYLIFRKRIEHSGGDTSGEIWDCTSLMFGSTLYASPYREKSGRFYLSSDRGVKNKRHERLLSGEIIGRIDGHGNSCAVSIEEEIPKQNDVDLRTVLAAALAETDETMSWIQEEIPRLAKTETEIIRLQRAMLDDELSDEALFVGLATLIEAVSPRQYLLMPQSIKALQEWIFGHFGLQGVPKEFFENGYPELYEKLRLYEKLKGALDRLQTTFEEDWPIFLQPR